MNPIALSVSYVNLSNCMSVLVYRYGLLPPTREADRVEGQMWLAHRYRNNLIEIERGRRAAQRELLSTSTTAISDLEAAAADADRTVERLVREVSAAKSTGRTAVVPAELREALSLARRGKSDTKRALREARKTAREDLLLRQEADRLNNLANELSKNARQYSGVYWGTYQLIDEAMQQSKRMPLYDGTSPNDPRFVRWHGEGEVGIQLQGGLDAAGVFGDGAYVRIAPVDERAWYSSSRGERRKLSRTVLSLRVGSVGTAPIFAEWPMVMHRPLPKGCVLKQATVHRTMHGPRAEWYVTLTVDTSKSLRPEGRQTDGVVALDLGWRTIANDIRIAAWRDDQGAEGTVTLDADLQNSLRRAESLRSTRDVNFNAARATLTAQLQALRAPTWLLDKTSTMSRWRSMARLSQLAFYWRDHRFEGDTEAFSALEAWRYHDHHLWSWETSQGVKSHRRRKELYRTTAAWLARRYRTIIFEKFDLRPMARSPAPESEEVKNKTARSNRQLVAVGEFRACVVHAANMNGRTVAFVDAVNTTKTCHECGFVNEFDAAANINHACNSCGVIWDQDYNACSILLARYCEQSDGSEVSGSARTPQKETKRERIARLRAEKLARAKNLSQTEPETAVIT